MTEYRHSTLINCAAIHAFIVLYRERNDGRSPSYLRIAKAVKRRDGKPITTSSSVIKYYIDIMLVLGMVKKGEGFYALTPAPKEEWSPLVLDALKTEAEQEIKSG